MIIQVEHCFRKIGTVYPIQLRSLYSICFMLASYSSCRLEYVKLPAPAIMRIFGGGFRSRRKTQHCIHEYQGRQPEEPSEGPMLETTNQLPRHMEAATSLEVNPSDATEANPSVTQPIARDSKGRCQICRNEQLAARRYRIRLIVGKLQVFRAIFLCYTGL